MGLREEGVIILIHDKIFKDNYSSKVYVFIDLHVEDFRGKPFARISDRVIKLAKLANGSRRGNVLRIPRSGITNEIWFGLRYSDKLSSRYKQVLIKYNFNYYFRKNNLFHSKGKFKKL